jgi:predicted peroxiredoxin
MTERFLINATHGTDDPDRAMIALVMANAALTVGKDAVLLSSLSF